MTKSAVLRVGGEERRVITELVRRLVQAGLLEHPRDAEFLSDGELDQLAVGQDGPGLASLDARRAAFEAMREAAPLPETFSGVPAIAEPEATPTGDVLRGWATSPGHTIGTARVVHDLADAHDLARGEILVGRSTDPSWTPLFLTAGAIVMEEGGPLSHAAIVAREFRLPAVLNVKGATRRIRTGMRLAVDGTRGTVEIISDTDADVAADAARGEDKGVLTI